jgi:hypothetical protein
LLEVVEGADPSFGVGPCELEHWLIPFCVPKIDGAVLACGYELLEVDAPHSIDGIVVPFVYYFSLFFSFPRNHLTVVARGYEILTVETVNIEDLCTMLVESLDQPSLGKVPLLESEICTNGAKIIGVCAEFNAIYGIFMPSQSVNQLQRPRVPELNLAVITSSGEHVFIGVKRKCQNITAMMIGILS